MNEKGSKNETRLSYLFDENTFMQIDSLVKSDDEYTGVTIGFGYINGLPAYVFCQDKSVNGAPISKAHALKILKIYELSFKTGTPVIGIYDSIGAKLDEQNEMLKIYGKVLKVSNKLSGVVPQISLILGDCIGTSALIAMASDIIVMQKDAHLGLETDGKDSDSDFAANNGLCHIVTDSVQESINMVRDIFYMLPSNNLSDSIICDTIDCAGIGDHINKIFDKNTFIEFQKGFGQAFKIGLARLFGRTVGVIYSFGEKIDSNSCSKASRMIRFCDSFSIPIISFINSDGFESLKDASKLSSSYSESTTVKISVITKNAYGALYIATAGEASGADLVFAYEDAVISPLSPETSVSIMWQDKLKDSNDPIKDRVYLIEEYKETTASAINAANQGFVDDIVNDDDIRNKLINSIDMLYSKRLSNLPKKHSNIQL